MRIDTSLIDARFLNARGLVNQLPWPQAAAEEVLEDGRPVRAFPVRAGRRIAPGWWWSATNGGLVHYGFGAMRTQLMLLDFDRSVKALACSPVELEWTGRGGRKVRHVPHLLARLRDGSGVLVDCAGSGGISRRLSGRTRVMEAAAESVGWHYRVVGAPDGVVAANVRWLAGFRHPRNAVGVDIGDLVACFARPRPLVDGVRELGDPIAVWPAVFHALWTGDISVPLDKPLHERVVTVADEGVRP
ncbi:TnsA-like heteromeric transposase endonuclease subunit [Streptomyces sp. NPDC002738]